MPTFVIPGLAVGENPESIHPPNLRPNGFRARADARPGMTASVGDEDDFFTGIE